MKKMKKNPTVGTMFLIFLIMVVIAFSLPDNSTAQTFAVIIGMIGGFGAFVTGGLWLSDTFSKKS
jgi:hypothetical protein